VLKLLRQWLEAGVMEDGTVYRTPEGTPQGGVISPLLANIYLHVLDKRWTLECSELGMLVRYADDFVVMCDSASACEEAERRIAEILSSLGLELHPEKTRRVDLTWGQDGFTFLGCYLRRRLSGRLLEKYGWRRYYLQRWPGKRAMKRVRERVKEKTGRNRCGVRDVRDLIRLLNPYLRGWGNYFRTGNAARQFGQVDDYVVWRLRRLMIRRKGRNLRAGEARQWNRAFFEGHGLYRLRGTIRYPEAA
jgi:group II intron reverse transcriptase/maturase